MSEDQATINKVICYNFLVSITLSGQDQVSIITNGHMRSFSTVFPFWQNIHSSLMTQASVNCARFPFWLGSTKLMLNEPSLSILAPAHPRFCPGSRPGHTAARPGGRPQGHSPVFPAPSSRSPVGRPRPRSSRLGDTWRQQWQVRGEGPPEIIISLAQINDPNTCSEVIRLRLGFIYQQFVVLVELIW